MRRAHNRAMTAITDVPGLRVGHAGRTGEGWLSGVTVVLPPPGTVGSVDVRGGGPGTHETDALDPTTLTRTVDAVVLTGGSAFGLAAAHGAQRWCEENGRGFPVTGGVVPIVPAAAIFDLGRGGDFAARPDAAMGYEATGGRRRPQRRPRRRTRQRRSRHRSPHRPRTVQGRNRHSLDHPGKHLPRRPGGRRSPSRRQCARVTFWHIAGGGVPPREHRSLGEDAAGQGRQPPAPQHHPRRRRHQRHPGQGRVQAHGVGRPRRTGPGAESQPHPGGRGHGLLPRHRRARAGPRQRGRPAGEPHHPAERGSRRRAPRHPRRDRPGGVREHAGGRIWCIRALSTLRLLDLTFGP